MERVKSLREEFPSLIDRAYELLRKPHFVEDIMSRNVVTVSPETTMSEAAKLMGAKRIGSLIVEVKEKYTGIVTERDLLSKVLIENKNPEMIKVGDVMSSPLITIEPAVTIKEAAQKMISRKGRLAVFTSGKLVGIITASDLIKSLPESPEASLKVDKVMTHEVISVGSSTTVEEAIKIMGEERIGSVIVTKRGKPYGIFTERDLLTTFLTRGKSLKVSTGSAASSPLITIPLGTSINQAALTMTLKHIRRLPISNGYTLSGIVTARDLVEAYAK